MRLFSLSKTAKRALLAGSLAIATLAGTAVTAGFGPSAANAAPGINKEAPTGNPNSAKLPGPVPVTVDPATTAYLVLDDTSAVCTTPACIATLPPAAALLARARAAGALVVFSMTGAAGSTVLPPVGPPLPTDPVVVGHADKFFNTDLDQILTSHGIKTLVIVGTAANGAVLYTTFEANLNGFTVVVAEDGVSAGSPYILRYSLFQLLNEPGFTNATNAPLTANAVTLSETNLIRFAAAS